MRRFLSWMFFSLALRAQKRAEGAYSVAWKIRWRRRSEFWADLDIWILGLASWRQLRNVRDWTRTGNPNPARR